MAVMLAAVLCVALGAGGAVLSGCSPSKVDVTAQQKQECFDNQSKIKMAIGLVHADSGIYPDVASVVKELDVKCPAGGTYSFDEKTDTVSCSVHGHP